MYIIIKNSLPSLGYPKIKEDTYYDLKIVCKRIIREIDIIRSISKSLTLNLTFTTLIQVINQTRFKNTIFPNVQVI